MKTYYVRLTKDMGRGVFADRDFKVGEVITHCELLVLSPEDTVKVNQTNLEFYTFKYSPTQDCLVLGDGEIFNHADSPNVSYEIVTITDSVGTRSLMKFTTLKPILQDEQMFIDYGADVSVDATKYRTNLIA